LGAPDSPCAPRSPYTPLFRSHDGLRVYRLSCRCNQRGCYIIVKHRRNTAMISQLMFYPSWGKDLLNQFLEDARNFAPDSNIGGADRKSTRLNSSHVSTSYADY